MSIAIDPDADPNIITARQIAAMSPNGSAAWRDYMIAGAYDDDFEVRAILLAIKVGRGLDPKHLPHPSVVDALIGSAA